jgi:hypothetical protein
MKAVSSTLLVLAALVFAFPQSAFADTIHCDVRCIKATMEGDSMADELKPLEKKLRKAFDGYHSFELMSLTPLDIELDQKETVDLPNKSTLALTFNGREEDYIKLNLQIDDRLSTDLRIASGGTFFQAMMHDDGILIIAVTAN